MEVLTPYSHHQLGTSLKNDVLAPHNLCGVELNNAYGKEASQCNPSGLLKSNVTNHDGADSSPDLIGGSEEDIKGSLDKEEKDSDAGETSVTNQTAKTSKKDKEKAQIEYLLGSLPSVEKFFKVHGKIGEGTFSSVFLASLKDAPLEGPLAGRQFAVKHLIPTTHPSRAERELRCLQDIGGYDNVVGVHLCLRHLDNIAFIMPYLPHKRFHEYVMEMGVTETRNYMKQLLLALRRVHSFNIIHRDVKPSNFLYNRDTKQFLLVDFGLSQPVEETSKVCSPCVPPSVESRKRKREKESYEDLKLGFSVEPCENPAKRTALALNNSTNIIKTPEKQRRASVDVDVACKSVPQLISSRAKRLQNITNKNSCASAQKTSAVSMDLMRLKSPAKDAIESSHSKKTPRKSKNHPNTENISPLKYENQLSNKKASRFDTNEIWRDEPSKVNEKHPLDLRQVKRDSDAKRPVPQVGSKSSLQRKILFDDVPVDNSKVSRFSVMAPSRQAYSSSRVLTSRSRTLQNTSLTASSDSVPLSPIDQSGGFGKEFRTLAPECSTDEVAGSSIVRVQNSQVKSQQLSPVAPNETQSVKSPANQQLKLTEKSSKIVFAKPQTPSANGSLHRSNTPSSPHCNCTGRAQVCTICLSRKAHNAPRAGTPGFRPPEVLLRSPIQSTAVDMWAVGVILLCILSGCYPFFRSPDDLTALAEIMTVFGTDKIKETAKRLGRLVVCSQPSQPLDLKKLCTRMRQRRKERNNASSSSVDSSAERCLNCCQPSGNPDRCICEKEQISLSSLNPFDVNNIEESDDIFPDSAYHLLSRLLDLDADTRITAAQALDHPFVTGYRF